MDDKQEEDIDIGIFQLIFSFFLNLLYNLFQIYQIKKFPSSIYTSIV